MAQTPIRDAKTHLKLADTCYNAKSLAEERRVSQLQIQGSYYDTYDKESALRISDLENGYSASKFACNLMGDNLGAHSKIENIIEGANPQDPRAPEVTSSYGFWYQDYTSDPGITPNSNIKDPDNSGDEYVGTTCHKRFAPNNIVFTDNQGRPAGGYISRDGHFINIDPVTPAFWVHPDEYSDEDNVATYAANAIPLLDGTGKLPLKYMPADSMVYSGKASIITDDNGVTSRWAADGMPSPHTNTAPGAYWIVQLADELKDETYANVSLDGTVLRVRQGDWIVYRGDNNGSRVWDVIENDELKGLTNTTTTTYKIDETNHLNNCLDAGYTTHGLVSTNTLLDVLHMRGDTICTGQSYTGNPYGTSLVPKNDDNSSCTSYVTNVRQNDGIVSFDSQTPFHGWRGLFSNATDVSDDSLNTGSTNDALNKLATSQAVVGFVCQTGGLIRDVTVTETTPPLTINLFTPQERSGYDRQVEINTKTLTINIDNIESHNKTFDAKTDVTIDLAPLSHAYEDDRYGLSSEDLYGHAKASGDVGKAATSYAGNKGSMDSTFAKADHEHAATCYATAVGGDNNGILKINSNHQLESLGTGTPGDVLISNGDGTYYWGMNNAHTVDGWHLSIVGNTATFS